MTERTNLLDFTLPGLTEWFALHGEKAFRARQVFQWIHQRGVADFDAMTDLAKQLREKLKAIAEVKTPAILSEHRSEDGTVKWLFDVGVGNGIETVYIPEDNRGTLCVSSQVGCALDCKFCSTGRQGFNRDLMGATDPKKAAAGTIRKDFAQSIDANAVHGSDAVDTAQVEIAYFFPSSRIYGR